MPRSLAARLILAFLLVSLIVALLGAWIARWLTVQEFQRLVLEQAQTRFITNVTTYYQVNGSWIGVAEYLGIRLPKVQPVRPLPLQLPLPEADGRAALIFILADWDGTVIIPARPYRVGEILPAATLSQAAPVEVNGQVVGYALATGEIPELDPREERYLARTNQALLYASLAAMLIALLLGVLLARGLTRPLRQLTGAIRRMSQGELEQRVEVDSPDEIGELAEAFNQMSANLARANQLRRQMTADIAHDLRTPLTVISGYVEALRDQVLAPSAERFETIYTEVQHLLRLVDDLRTLSLADAGELPLNRQPLDPAGLLGRIVSAYTHQARAQGVQLQVQASAQLPEINVDEERMVQVLGNLVSNALRYTSAGGRVTLSAAAQGNFAQLGVQDTGQGIPPEALERVFERFYRGDASRQRGSGESGLGLAIARSIVEAHGGRIEVESKVGEGTRFVIWLPV
ncbi:MAG: ATP-binding protein [Chloroflexota bacterium]